MGILKNLFSKKRNEKAICYKCGGKIYEGDKYGHDDEPGNLLLGGYYFCNTCIGRQNVGQIIVGQIYMFSDGQQRYRLRIKQ